MDKSSVVWLLSDGVPGHVNQSKGMLNLLGLNYQQIEVRVKMKFLRPLMRLIVKRCGYIPFWLLKVFYTLPSLKDAMRPELIVSAGGNTSFANLSFAHLYSARNLFMGSLRGLPSKCFSCFCTLEDYKTDNNVQMKIAPSLISPESSQKAAEAMFGSLDQNVFALIVGGDGAGFSYSNQDWMRLGQLINSIAETEGIKWVVTTSRRTGKDAENLLKASIEDANIYDACWWAESPRKVMQAYLGAASKVVCTADSMSMISECLSVSKPLLVVSGSSSYPDMRYKSALNRLFGSNILVLDDRELSSDPLFLDLNASLECDACREQVLALLKL
jgi:mitochondrial fission protein ELM1